MPRLSLPVLTLLGLLCLAIQPEAQSPPAWWAQRGATNANPANDHAAVTQGQLKHFTQKAVEELNARIPGGAGPELNSLVDGWVQEYQLGNHSAQNPLPADFHAMTAGQLKWIANQITARLIHARYMDDPPAWLAITPDDIELANLGQLKTVFDFDLTAPPGQLPEWWQKFYFNGQTGIDPEADPNGNGISNLDEYLNGTDPGNPDINMDSDGDGMPDWWEMSFAASLLALGNPPDSWGANYSDLLAGNLNPDTDYTGEGITAGELARLASLPPSEQPVDGIHWQWQGKRNILAWGLHVPATGFQAERNEGLYLYTNDGWYGDARNITAKAELEPQYLASQVLLNSWEDDMYSSFSSFWVTPHAGYTNYSGEIRIQRHRMVVPQPAETAVTRHYLKILSRQNSPNGYHEIMEIESKQFSIPATKLSSNWIELIPPVVSGWKYTLNLLPMELRVRQDNVPGPHGSPPMYATPRPDDGNAVGELFSLWPAEEAYVTLGGALADLIQAGNLPANFVKWSAPDLPNKTNEKEYKVHWNNSGLKVVKLEIGGQEFLIRINVPDTGSMKLHDDALKNHVGLANWALCGALGVKARTNVALWTGESPENGGTRQDALRHSLWNMLSAAAIGLDKTIAITTANEHTGRMDQAAYSSNTTMDLFNNGRGAAEGAALYQPGGTQVDTLVGFNHMKQIFDNAGLRAWTPPANNVSNHHHMLRKSDQTTIYPRQ